MIHSIIRFLLGSVLVVITVVFASLLSDTTRASESSLPVFAADREQFAQSTVLTDEFGRYSLSVPDDWSVSTNKQWDNDDAIKFDALVGLTAPDGEIVSMRVWEDVSTGLEESLELYLQPFSSSDIRVHEGKLRGNTFYVAVDKGDPGGLPTSVFAFVQCNDVAFRFEYISIAGGTQFETFGRILESFQCEPKMDPPSKGDLSFLLSAVSMEDLVAYREKVPQNPCQGYLDPNGNRFGCGECTWWASYSRPDIPNTWEEWHGNANEWDDNAVEHPDFSVSSTPEVGSIAVWEEWQDYAQDGGHVAYVTRVNGDGTFNVTDMNWPFNDEAKPPRERPSIQDSQSIDFIVGGVTFFEDPNFGGRWYRIRSSEPDLTYSGVAASSIFIPASWDAVFYREKNYSTASYRERWGTTTLKALESSFWNLGIDYFSDGSNMNNNVRSVKVVRNACLQPRSADAPSYEADEGCGDNPPDDTDTIAPSASSFSASVSNGRTAGITASGVQDNNGGSGVREVRFSAKWGGNWYGIGTDSSSPYSLSWDMCSNNVPNGDVELGMEVWDNADNSWVWSNSHTNPHITKESACGGSGNPLEGGVWESQFWMNRYLAGYVNWSTGWLWDDGKWPYIWFDWGIKGPRDDWSGDEFSLRIWRNVYFPGGQYEFRTDSDDGVRVYVDNSVVVDHWWSGTGSGGRSISEGWHEVKVEYYENTGDAKLSVVWYGPGYPQPDFANPDGRITTPTHQSATNSNPLPIWAEAWDDASGVDYVRFLANYCQGGECKWRELGVDRDAPYSYTWNWDGIDEQHIWLTIDVVDRSGKVTGSPGGLVEVDLDKTNPAAEITAPPEGSYLTASTVPILAMASDGGSGVASVQFFAGFSDNTGEYWHELGKDETGSDGWQLNWNAGGVQDQRDVAFFVYAYDRAGNYVGAARWASILDRVKPASEVQPLAASSPASFVVQWNGSDATSGIASYDIQVQVDGGYWEGLATGVTQTSSTFTGNPGHTYGFRSRARDMAGLEEEWPPSADTVTTIDATDTQSPEVTWLEPVADGEEYDTAGETVLLKVQATDNIGVVKVAYNWLNEANWQQVPIAEDTEAPFEVSFDTHVLNKGCNVVNAKAIDAAGNFADAFINICLTDTAEPPAAPTLQPIDNSAGLSYYSVVWSVGGNATSYQLQEAFDGGNWMTVYEGISGSYFTYDQENGDWCYRVRGWNNAGESEWSNIACTSVRQAVDLPFKLYLPISIYAP